MVMLPRGPFLESHGGRFAYVLDHGVAVRRPIRIGVTSASSVEILDGVTPGQRVVIAGSEDFGDAATVRVID